MYENEFENIYSCMLLKQYHVNLEKELFAMTTQRPMDLSSMLNEFLVVLNEPVLHRWIEVLHEFKYIFYEDRTNRDKKQLRVLLRQVCRLAEQNDQVHRLLDLMVHFFHVEEETVDMEVDEESS